MDSKSNFTSEDEKEDVIIDKLIEMPTWIKLIENPQLDLFDIQLINQIKKLIFEGKDFTRYVYSYRNISYAVPANKFSFKTPSDKIEYVNKFIEIFEKKMALAIDLKNYIDKTIAFIEENIKNVFDMNKFFSTELRLCFTFLIDIFLTLNYVFQYNGAITNDFSRLKREQQISPKTLDSQFGEKIMKIANLFNRPNYIVEVLKEKLQRDKTFASALHAIIYFLFKEIKQNRYFTPVEDLSFKRCIFFAVYLSDSVSNNVFKKVKIVTKLRKLFLGNSFLPMYKDCNMSTRVLLQSCPNFRNEKEADWIIEPDAEKTSYSLKSAKLSSSEESFEFLMKIYPHSFDHEQLMTLAENKETAVKKAEDFINLLTEGSRLISSWKIHLKRHITYKLENFISEEEFKQIKKEKVSAEREDDEEISEDENEKENLSLFLKKVKYNFSKEELNDIIGIVSTMKNVKDSMLKKENEFIDCVKIFYFYKISYFMKNELRDTSSIKKFSNELKEEIKKVYKLICDTELPLEKSKNKKTFNFLKKRTVVSSSDEVNIKLAIPTEEQVMFLCYAIEKVLFENKQNHVLGKDKNRAKVWEKMRSDLQNFHNHVHCKDLLIRICDISMFWFKELNLSLSKCNQFPIEITLPGIIFHYLMQHFSHIPLIMQIFNIYSDAGKKALLEFKKKHLYEEIEAECSLLFDQFLYTFCHRFATLTQQKAVLMVSPYSEKEQFRHDSGDDSFDEYFYKNFIKIASNKELVILGRRINLNKLVCQQLNNNLRELLDYQISKLEELGISNLLEFQLSLQVFEKTCSMIRDYVPIDSFEQIYEEVNETVGMARFESRISKAMIYNVGLDLFTDYNYDSTLGRFERVSWTTMDESEYEELENKYDRYEYTFAKMSKVHKEIFQKDRCKFVNSSHIKAMIEILSVGELTSLMNEIIYFGEEKMKNKIKPYFKSINDALTSIKTPPETFGFVGAHTTIELKLKPIDEYGPLRSHILQAMKELGNTMCFANLLSQVIKSNEIGNFVNIADIFGIHFKIKENKERIKFEGLLYPEKNKLSEAVRRCVESNKSLGSEYCESGNFIADSIEKFAEATKKCQMGDFLAGLLYRLTHCFYQSGFLMEFAGKVYCDEIKGLTSEKDITAICNTIKFLVCNSKQSEKHEDDLERFGESIIWALTSFIYMSDKINRFEMVDFCSFLQKINNKDIQKENETKQNDKGVPAKTLLQMSYRATNFLLLSKRFECVYDYVVVLFKKLNLAPIRQIEIDGKDGKSEWVEDSFEKKYYEEVIQLATKLQ